LPFFTFDFACPVENELEALSTGDITMKCSHQKTTKAMGVRRLCGTGVPHGITLLAITMLVGGLTAAQALTPAGPGRPASVPRDYVVTPFGYFHPSCVTPVGEGDTVRQDENAIQHSDGTYDNIRVCAYPHYKANGEKVTGDVRAVKEPTISHAWVESASTTTNTSFGALSAYWNVPAAPTTNDGQTLFLFPGMEDYNDVVTIIQPVLGWNSDYASAWGIASWNCCAKGTVFEGPPVRVNSGDVIFGEIFNTCGPGILSCPSWYIDTYDRNLGKGSVLRSTSSEAQIFNWAFAGVLEVYNVARCTDYPANNFKFSFYDLTLVNNDGDQIANPEWFVTNSSAGLTPQCNYGGAMVQQVQLTY
jgi:hypothetical protein